MMVHRLIDALKNGRNKNLYVVPELGQNDIDQIVQQLRLAEKFDFGALHLESVMPEDFAEHFRTSTINGKSVDGDELTKNPVNVWNVPSLTTEEESYIDEGLVPLPAPLSWFEFILGSHTSGLLIDANGWKVMRIDFDRNTGSGMVDGMWCVRTRQEKDGTSTYALEGNPDLIAKIESMGSSIISVMTPAANWNLARYFTFMLYSKSTEIEYVQTSSKKLKRHSSLSTREPLPDHRIVRIIPRRFLRHDSEGPTRLSPRLHWRRSHIRTLHDGKRIVIARTLVGKAELGVVTHEYKIEETS
jgi:hypothetical protein